MASPQHSTGVVEPFKARFRRLWRDDPLPGAAAFGISRAQQKEVRRLAQRGRLSPSVELAEASRGWASVVLYEALAESDRKSLAFALVTDVIVGVVEFFTAGATAGQHTGDLRVRRRTRRVARQVMDAAPTG